MLDLRLFGNRTFTGATAIVALLAGGPFGAFVYVTLFLLDVQERDPVEAGLVLAPLALVSFVVVRRWPGRDVGAGAAARGARSPGC